MNLSTDTHGYVPGNRWESLETLLQWWFFVFKHVSYLWFASKETYVIDSLYVIGATLVASGYRHCSNFQLPNGSRAYNNRDGSCHSCSFKANGWIRSVFVFEVCLAKTMAFTLGGNDILSDKHVCWKSGMTRSSSLGHVLQAGELCNDVPDSEEAIRRGEYTVIRSLIRVLEVILWSICTYLGRNFYLFFIWINKSCDWREGWKVNGKLIAPSTDVQQCRFL